MNRIKDFFYNKNDLFVVLIILVLAAGIIYYSVIDIMSYPEKLAAGSQTTVTEEVSSGQDNEQTEKED